MLKTGMYVRCPIDRVIDDARTFYLGQVIEIDDEMATIEFYDQKNLRKFFVDIPETLTVPNEWLSRSSVLENTYVNVNSYKGKILSVSQNKHEDDYKYYYVEFKYKGETIIREVCESKMKIPFTRANYNPLFQMEKYELQNPQWYLKRKIVSKSLCAIDNAPFGFKDLLGTRVHLFEHQVDTIVRALSESPCRLMLADEVGLGKTIETMAIIKGLLNKQPELKTLIIVPDPLIYQWQTEISFKFWIDAPVYGVDKVSDSNMVIVSYSNLIKKFGDVYNMKKWDICVVDETHKLIHNEELFDKTLTISEKTDNLLLLSATPILHREEEYSKLLTLLNPQRFKNMNKSAFKSLLDKQKNIQDIVFDLMQDLPDYLEYNLASDFIDGFNDIYDEINDEKLLELIKNIDPESEDKGLSQVKLILSYIAEFYQIERGIIRHRRAEIESADIKRKLIEIPYEMAGSDVRFNEENTYNLILDLTTQIIEDCPNQVEIVKQLLSATFSSPYALNEILNKYDKELKKYELTNLIYNLDEWKNSYDQEISKIKDVTDYVDDFNSKFSKIIDYIDQEDTKNQYKFIVFTGFVSTAIELEKCFKNFFGDDAVSSFHSGKTPEEMQEAATKFQNEDKCRFMICDESGGEGRNFQIADYIVHLDLPWSPALLEQRIGRLDRIGRDSSKDVTSIVVYSESTVENSLFDIYNKSLNIFQKSLCGMEIAFEEINNSIENAIKDDVRFGLSYKIDEISKFAEKINEEIEKERYYDLARQLDIELKENLNKLIKEFTENDGKELMDTMMAWPAIAGFRGITVRDMYKDNSKVVSINTTDFSERSLKNSLYFPPKMDEIIRRSKTKNDILGTFSRSSAVKHENLTFFGPFNPLFDSITDNALECYRGRSVALRYTNSELEWNGFILIWNIKFNPQKLYENNFSPDLINLISRYLPTEQVFYTKGLTKEFDEIDSILISDEFDILSHGRAEHLGKRDNGKIDLFKRRTNPEIWKKVVRSIYKDSKNKAIEKANISINVEKAKNDLDKVLTAQKARQVYYDYVDENETIITEKQVDALIYGLENPIYELDSYAYVELTTKII